MKKQRSFASRSSSSSRPGLERAVSQVDPPGSTSATVLMMTLHQFCLGHHRGVSGYVGTPSFPAVNAHTEHRVLSLLLDDQPNVPPPPDPKPVIWLVSMGLRLYRRLSHAALTLLTVRTPHRAILPWARYPRIDPLGLNQNARWKDPLLATPVITPG